MKSIQAFFNKLSRISKLSQLPKAFTDNSKLNTYPYYVTTSVTNFSTTIEFSPNNIPIIPFIDDKTELISSLQRINLSAQPENFDDDIVKKSRQFLLLSLLIMILSLIIGGVLLSQQITIPGFIFVIIGFIFFGILWFRMDKHKINYWSQAVINIQNTINEENKFNENNVHGNSNNNNNNFYWLMDWCVSIKENRNSNSNSNSKDISHYFNMILYISNTPVAADPENSNILFVGEKIKIALKSNEPTEDRNVIEQFNLINRA